MPSLSLDELSGLMTELPAPPESTTNWNHWWFAMPASARPSVRLIVDPTQPLQTHQIAEAAAFAPETSMFAEKITFSTILSAATADLGGRRERDTLIGFRRGRRSRADSSTSGLRDHYTVMTRRAAREHLFAKLARLCDRIPEVSVRQWHEHRREMRNRAEYVHRAVKAFQSNDVRRIAEIININIALILKRDRDRPIAQCAVKWYESRRKMGAAWQAPRLQLPKRFINDDRGNTFSNFVFHVILHVSEADPNQVAYYATMADVIRGRETRTTMARFLTKWFGPNAATPFLTEAEIKAIHERFVSRHAQVDNVQFIENTDPAGWVRIYEEGPDSCMQGSNAVRVYARPGNHLRLAYVTTEGGTPIGRAIVRQDTNPPQFVRVYPNPHTDEGRELHTMFRAKLEEMGYVHGNLDGIKLAYKECGDGIVCPYVDVGSGGSSSAHTGSDATGEYLQLGTGSLLTDTTAGYIEGDNRSTCDTCEDRFAMTI